MSLGTLVREYRYSRDMNQPSLARALGVSTSFISSLERNQAYVNQKILSQLALLLNKTTQDLKHLAGKRYRENFSECECCGARVFGRTEPGDTICAHCDEQLEKEELAEQVELERKHAEKYKCLKCKNGLPLTRRQYCFDCREDTSLGVNEDFLYFVDTNHDEGDAA
jgi:transcriptional regulator with XRE-family HTH domain